MIKTILLLKESLLFSLQALMVNKLRTFLSLSGITIGIFSIISVFTMVDSLEMKVKDSISSLGDQVIFVQKWPWTFGPGYAWWKYWQRPEPNMNEMNEIIRRSNLAEAATFTVKTRKNLYYLNSIVENVEVVCVSYQYYLTRNFNVEKGRYFTEFEANSGKNLVLIGHNIATSLFPNSDPIGKSIKIGGKKLIVIGVLNKEGDSMISETLDNTAIIPINYAAGFINMNDNSVNPTIQVKPREGISNAKLIDELTSIMRSLRRLKPNDEDNFALNETSLLTKGFSGLFVIINLAGGIIGIFSIIVGGFGIANIMFVSVKERTSIIGIEKALGAKNYFILFEFLSEAVILSLIGGIAGLFLIFLGTLIAQFMDVGDIYLSWKNITIGLIFSIVIGLLSGILPAISASKLNPVDAIRSN
jgi:putative ABC transport system permease protein